MQQIESRGCQMKTYTVKPEGINPVRKRMLLFGAFFLVIVLAGVGLIMPDIPLVVFGFVVLFVLIFGGLGFRRGLKRLGRSSVSRTWTSVQSRSAGGSSS